MRLAGLLGFQQQQSQSQSHTDPSIIAECGILLSLSLAGLPEQVLMIAAPHGLMC